MKRIRGLSAVVLYCLYFCLFAVIATTLLEVISVLSSGGAPLNGELVSVVRETV